MYTHWNVSVTTRSISLGLLNCMLIAVDRSLQSYLLKRHDFSMSPSMCAFVNNVFGILPMLVLAMASDEIQHWTSAVNEASRTSWCWVLISGCCGCSLGYFAVLTQKFLSATTFLMLQNLNKIVIILLGVFVMHDQMPQLSALGCGLSLLGSYYYCCLQLPVEMEMQRDLTEGDSGNKRQEQQKV